MRSLLYWLAGGIGLVVCSGAFWWSWSVGHSAREASEVSLPDMVVNEADVSVINQWFTPLEPLTLAGIPLLASVADTAETRATGLSGTPYLPDGIVKLFVFDDSQTWSFWMKDMNYAIDMVWLDESFTVVHIATEVSPQSFPASYAPPVPARYVIETVAGFTAEAGVTVGSAAIWTRQ